MYASIDPRLPQLIVQAAMEYDRHAYHFAVISTLAAWNLAAVAIGGFIYLIVTGHPGGAGSLLGATVVGMIAGFRRSRL